MTIAMTAPIKPYSPPTRRGSETRSKVIKAGIRCIIDHGFHNASTNTIARQANVTWGTLQHQFGDKASLLEAILEFCFEQHMEQMAASTGQQQTLKERISSLVDTVWRSQQTEHNRVIAEILQGIQRDSELKQRFNPSLQKLRDAYNQQWQDFFADVAIDVEQMEAIKQLTYSALRGLYIDLPIRSSSEGIELAKQLLKQAIFDAFSTAQA